jgi:acyl-CoA reductase-like NAD-dependent aldehyde dehydrogenase
MPTSGHGQIYRRVASAAPWPDAATIDCGNRRAPPPRPSRWPGMASYERQNVLQHCVDRFKERFDELAYALCVEAGKPIKDSEGEVGA